MFFQPESAHSGCRCKGHLLHRCIVRVIWLASACRYLGTMPGMKPGQVLGHEVRLSQKPSCMRTPNSVHTREMLQALLVEQQAP